MEYRRWWYVLRDAAALSKVTAGLPGQWKKLTEANFAVAVRVRGGREIGCPPRGQSRSMGARAEISWSGRT